MMAGAAGVVWAAVAAAEAKAWAVAVVEVVAEEEAISISDPKKLDASMSPSSAWTTG